MSRRYQVGCAGRFALAADGAGYLHGAYDDAGEAIVACEDGPVGCEVYDTIESRWIGPGSFKEIEDAKRRIAARNA